MSLSQIEDVRFSEDLPQGGRQPEVAARCCFNPISSQSFTDVIVTSAFQVLPKDSSDHLGFFRIDDELPLFILIVPEKPVCADLDLSLLVPVLQSQPDVL